MFGFTMLQTTVICVLIVLILILIGYIVRLIVNRKWEELRALAYKGMLEAERVFGNKKGYEKFMSVVHTLVMAIPNRWPFSLISLFINEEMILDKLQDWYDEIKDLLDDGVRNRSPGRTHDPGNIQANPHNTQTKIVIKPSSINIDDGGGVNAPTDPVHTDPEDEQTDS